MPRTLEIDHQRRLVITRYQGIVTDSDLLDCARELESSHFPTSFNELADLREVVHFEASATILRLIASRSTVFSHDSIRVILAPSAEAFGIGRMVQTFAEITGATPFSVVHEMKEAEQILGLHGSRESRSA